MYRLTPAVQSYDWGSPTAIPQFAGWVSDGSPVAEAWFGTHASAPSSIAGSDAAASLRDRVTAAPAAHLGAGIVERFGNELPFLLKLIAPARPLSLQVHPSLGQAALGWVQEQRVGVPLDAPHRTYKDPNHKPEMIYALSTFEAVSGFRAPRRALEVLAGLEAPLLSGTIERLRHGSSTQGMRSAFEYLLLGAKDRDEDVCALVDQIRARRDAGASPSDHADSIALTIAEHYPHDRGAIASLLLNPVTLQPGEAMFVPAGSPHAYLSGLGVELMASSDNVVRACMTTKFVDARALLDIVDAQPAAPIRLAPERSRSGVASFCPPVEDFELAVIDVDGGAPAVRSAGPRIVLAIQGEVDVIVNGETETLLPGAAVFLNDGEEATARGHGRLVRASVP